jgi:hypothetical protein
MTALTAGDLLWLEKRIERWIRFGRIAEETIVDRRRRIVGFEPDSVFAFARWASNNYGTIASRIDILRAIAPHERCATVPFVTPGADILLRQAGWPKVEAVLRAIDAVEAAGIAPEEACPDHWRHVHQRLSAGLTPRAYTRARHEAWRKRVAVTA